MNITRHIGWRILALGGMAALTIAVVIWVGQSTLPESPQSSGSPVTLSEKPNTSRSTSHTPTAAACESEDGASCERRDVSGMDLFSVIPSGVALSGGPEATVEEVLEEGFLLAGASPVHVAFRGTATAGSVRCGWRGIARTSAQREGAIRLWLGLDADDDLPDVAFLEAMFTATFDVIDPEYRETAKANFLSIAKGGLSEEYLFLSCYADYVPSEYLLGAGLLSPNKLTLAYDRQGEARSYELYRLEHEAGQFGGESLMSEGEFGAFLSEVVMEAESTLAEMIGGRETVVFLAPMGAHNAIAVEAWQAVAQWDLQTDDDDVVHAVRYGTPEGDPEYTQTLANLKSRITTAAAADDFADDRIENTSGLTQYYRDIGAYGDITPDDGSTATFTPAQPPAAYTCANDTAVTDSVDNRGLVHDCEALLEGKDALRGTATLDWAATSAITGWEGITTGGDPSRVTKVLLSSQSLTGSIPASLGRLFELTHLNLSNNSLTGDIPRELGWLHNLEELRLSGNSLTGCIPLPLKDVATNDLSSLNLLYCQPPAPGNLSAGTAGETSIPLSWNAVTNASRYRVEYRLRGDLAWTVDDETLTTTSHAVDELVCNSGYQFRVSAYGSGTVYAVAWSDGTLVSESTTESCNVAPVFDPATYDFSVTEDAEVGDDVGTVTATDGNTDDILTYGITEGNDDGKFDMDGSTGEITVAGTLDRETEDSYTLTVQVSDGNGETATATVTITVVDAACSGGIAAPDPDDNPGLVGDCQALMEAMDTLIGTGTTTLNWGFAVAMTTWDGVTVGGTPSRVTGLNLRAKGLAGSMPTTLGSLSDLQNLNLSRNELTGGIPAQLGSLSDMVDLNLSQNQLTGTIPTQLGNLSDLTALWLYNNQLSGGIPSELGSLSDLVWLILSGNQLTGAIPHQIGDLSDLSHLWLLDNQLSGEIPPEIGGLSSMQILRMHNNELTGPIPWQMGNLTGLSIIHVSGNDLEGCVPPALESVATNDFSTLGLSFCTQSGSVSTPTDLAVTLTGETFTISWTAVTEAEEYGVEYRIKDSGDEWTRLPTTEEVSMDYSPEGGPVCESAYEFRVRAYGDGETYSSSPGDASDEEEVTTGSCPNPPVFDQDSYTFSLAETVSVSTSVGSVSATDPDEDALTYSITLGNADGKFQMDGETGTITVAGPLDFETTISHTLTVQADDGTGGTDTATVTVNVTDVVEMWSATMTAAAFTVAHVNAFGYTTGVMGGDTDSGGPHGTLDDTSFIYGGETYTVELAAFVQAIRDILVFMIGLDERYLPEDTDMALLVNGHRLESWETTDFDPLDTNYYFVRNVDFTLVEGQQVFLSMWKTNLSSDTSLASLTLSEGTLSPQFDADTSTYTASVANSVSEVTVTASADSDYATVAVSPQDDDDAETDGVEVALDVGANTITVTVTAEDGTTQDYTLTITRAAA